MKSLVAKPPPSSSLFQCALHLMADAGVTNALHLAADARVTNALHLMADAGVTNALHLAADARVTNARVGVYTIADSTILYFSQGIWYDDNISKTVRDQPSPPSIPALPTSSNLHIGIHLAVVRRIMSVSVRHTPGL